MNYSKVAESCTSLDLDPDDYDYETSKAFNLIAEQFDWKLLGFGSSRVAFDIGDDKVLKIQYSTRFANQTKFELMIWHRVKDKPEAKWFLPILDFDTSSSIPLWTVVPKVEMGYISSNLECTLFEAVEKVQEGLSFDLCDSNMAMYKGHVVAIDYGYAS